MYVKNQLKKVKYAGEALLIHASDYISYVRATGFGQSKSKATAIYKLRKDYHKIEKGLTMEPRRNFFGLKVLDNIIQHIRIIDDCSNPEVLKAVDVIKKYTLEHQNPPQLQKYIDYTKGFNNSCLDSNTAYFSLKSKDLHLEAKDKDLYKRIIKTRRTTRHFSSRVISRSDFNNVFEVARFSPSACNRQSWKTKVITNKPLIKRVLSLQNGNSGFGEDVDNLLVITGDLSSCVTPTERKQIWFDSGLYTMNLINALHVEGIGSCCLNWCVNNMTKNKLASLLSLEKGEEATVLLAVGYYKDKFVVCNSPKKSVSEFIEYL
ncbi:nitroreductase family protein [Pseudoalteromonas sp. SCSIO 43088]|uniref:nitroreductase family protein n=1 Tax=Pseudoalteromonas sp. SCSIO 43088 TaxID=2822846 RepID=UPI00202B57F7|nr:nitroreductase family protein [Pseudoalteromonas sp. SCSIO 43088]URQ86598.1 nitroreductase family protein [Pseudoalteromonas sp. SCSIO 43088]